MWYTNVLVNLILLCFPADCDRIQAFYWKGREILSGIEIDLVIPLPVDIH